MSEADVLTKLLVQGYTKDGLSTYTLAERHDISRYRAKELLLCAKVRLRRSGRKVARATPEIIRAYEKGTSIRDLARENNLSYSTMRLQLQAGGVDLRKRGGGYRAGLSSRVP